MNNDFDAVLARLTDDEKVKLLHLLQAKHCFGRAIKEESVSVYSEALQLAQKALQFAPLQPEIHYIEAIARLKLFGDRDFVSKKYKLLMGLGSKEAMEFTIKLKEEIF